MPTADATELRAGDRHHELAATVALIRSQVVPYHRIAAIIDHYGSAVRAVRLSEDDRLFTEEHPSHEVIGAVTQEDIDEALHDVGEWLAAGYDVRSVLDANYPGNLHTIFNRPPLLFVRGMWDEQRDSRSIAVVGTRRASRDGLRRARRLSRELVAADFTILSGLATGIDTAAHTAALDAGGRTAAVMGTGINRIYPPENRGLASRILEAGCALISQFLPDQPPASWTFPNRNITMSGMSLATVVVEAAETSGARMQARVALQHGRTVFLLRSLVETHEWARGYVTEGVYDTRAIVIDSTEDIIGRLREDAPPEQPLGA